MNILKYLNDSKNSIAILLAIAILSMSYPYGFPLFGILTILFGALKIVSGKFKIRINIGFIVFFLSTAAYIFGMTMNQGIIYNHNISDLTNIISFFIMWFLLSDLKKEDYPILIHRLSKYAVFTSFVVSLISLFKFYLLLGNVKLEQFFTGADYPGGTSLVRDYNMFSFALTVGLIMAAYMLTQTKKMSHMLYYLMAFISIFASVLFAGSRRGWIVAAIIAVFVIFMILKALLRFDNHIIKIVKFGVISALAVLFIFLFTTLFNIEFDLQGSAQAQDLRYRLETLKFDQTSESLTPRTERWEYALRMFGESNIFQALFGQGFEYLPTFAKSFSPDLQEDYPHNPILSSLLYSGIIGAMLLIVLLICSAVLSLKNRKLIGINFTFLYFISYIFILVSSNSIFSNTLFITILLILISIPKTTLPKT